MDPSVLLKLIWESMNGPSEVDLGVELESIRGMFWGTFWSIWGPFWGPFWVHVEICQRFWPQTHPGPDFYTPGTDLGASLGPHVGPMMAPCWRRSGVLRRPWAFLDRSKGHMELNFDQHGKGDENGRRDF